MISNQLELEKSSFNKKLYEPNSDLDSSFENYTPNIFIRIITDKYTLSTAINLKELKELFLMRHHIFFIETGISNNISLDIDAFDLTCDHLVIRSNHTGEICATYRLLTKYTSSQFYSESEFNLTDFLKVPGTKLELGRACIHPAHRNGSLTDLLWKGIGEYLIKVNADFLFGCSSIKLTNSKTIFNILEMLKEKNYYSDDYNITAKEKYSISKNTLNGSYDYQCEMALNKKDKNLLLDYLPPLLKSYFLAGAKIHGTPALDKEFKCTDFFTILPLKQLNPSFKKRYLSYTDI